MNLESGIYYNIPFTEYQGWDAINNSTLVKILKESPAHAKEYKDNPPEQSKAFFLGSAAHKLILEPLKFDDEYCVMPKIDRRTKAGKEEYEEFVQNAGDKIVIDDETFNAVLKMSEAVGKTSIAREFLSCGEAEASIIWDCGIMAKARIDYLQDNLIVDLKTTANARPEVFAQSALKYSYDQQLAFYADSYEAITGERPSAVIIAVEKTPPFGVSVHQVTESTLLQGRELYKKAVEIYKECLVFDNWPCYPQEINLI